MSQFGFLYAGPGSSPQLTHIDDIFSSFISVFVLGGIDLGHGKVSNSVVPSTQFVDLKFYGLNHKTIFDINSKQDLLLLDEAEVWAPSAHFVKKKLGKHDVAQFYSTTLHRGCGNGGGPIERLVAFVCFTTRNLVLEYQKMEYQVLAPEILLLFHKGGCKKAKEYLRDWAVVIGRDSVLFNYHIEGDHYTTPTQTGTEIREILDSDTECTEEVIHAEVICDSDDEYVSGQRHQSLTQPRTLRRKHKRRKRRKTKEK